MLHQVAIYNKIDCIVQNNNFPLVKSHVEFGLKVSVLSVVIFYLHDFSFLILLVAGAA